MEKQYSHPMIMGRQMQTMLPEGYALVLEGGGTRGFYSAGVMDALMDADIMFPYIIGVSAGAANALSYVSGQKGRNRQVVAHYVGHKRYVSMQNLLLRGSLFGFDYIFDKVPNEHLYFDHDTFDQNPTRFLVGAINIESGDMHYFEKKDIEQSLNPVQASCSIPLASRIVTIDNMELLDGGTKAPIPIERSIADGNTFHVIVLTRNPGYQKKPQQGMALIERYYREYPKLCEAMRTRHENYNRQLALCEQLEREGKAVIIRPLEKLNISRNERRKEKLLPLYDEGHREGAEAIKKIII